jgi:hypothetical protein
MRIHEALLALLLAVTGAFAHAAGFEQDTDRPGSDYRSFDMPSPDPQMCRAQCDRESQCVAWTYVKPGIQGPAARGWLKHSEAPARAERCCHSGTRAPVAGIERGVDRPGADYRSFDLQVNDPLACKAQCDSEGPCRAWTYVRPGVQGPAPRCWLKTSAPAPRPDGCCVSGLRAQAAPPPPQAGGPDACNAACDQMCRARGRPGGSYTGGICLLGVRTSDSACTCR